MSSRRPLLPPRLRPRLLLRNPRPLSMPLWLRLRHGDGLSPRLASRQANLQQAPFLRCQRNLLDRLWPRSDSGRYRPRVPSRHAPAHRLWPHPWLRPSRLRRLPPQRRRRQRRNLRPPGPRLRCGQLPSLPKRPCPRARGRRLPHPDQPSSPPSRASRSQQPSALCGTRRRPSHYLGDLHRQGSALRKRLPLPAHQRHPPSQRRRQRPRRQCRGHPRGPRRRLLETGQAAPRRQHRARPSPAIQAWLLHRCLLRRGCARPR